MTKRVIYLAKRKIHMRRGYSAGFIGQIPVECGRDVPEVITVSAWAKVSCKQCLASRIV